LWLLRYLDGGATHREKLPAHAFFQCSVASTRLLGTRPLFACGTFFALRFEEIRETINEACGWPGVKRSLVLILSL
jgi:hypothetical protein